MKFIKKFEYFKINEDSIEDNSKENFLEELENNIKEFNNRKNSLMNIYLTYKREETADGIQNDLYNKLATGKFIKREGDKSKVTFINPLFISYSILCGKKREVLDIKAKITEKQTKLSEERVKLTSAEISEKEIIQNNINNLTNEIKELDKKLLDVNSEINDLDKKSREEIEEKIEKISEKK